MLALVITLLILVLLNLWMWHELNKPPRNNPTMDYKQMRDKWLDTPKK